ncbi:MAG: glycoside hydrolase family 3 N-terminal domain-containing protein [Burkholderiaceae bacterium]
MRPHFRIRTVAVLLLTLWLAACGGDSGSGRLAPDQLTLEQKIGQMVMMGFAGTRPDDPAVRQALQQIEQGRLGGIAFYRYNIEGPQQTRELNAAFQRANPLSLPLLIALDQEGGLVQRLRASNGFADTPSAEEVAATQTPQQAFITYRTMADMIRRAGFTLNMGPVVDLRGAPAPVSPVIGQLRRSFSDDPATVVRYAEAFIDAHHAAGVLTSIKHYPGHGMATADSHRGMVDITDTYQARERIPFRALIASGRADAIMGAHLIDRQVDADNPVTLSARYLPQRLRGEDGFDGVVVTDDLCMGAILQYYTLEQIVVRAIDAGNDVLVFSNNPAAAQGVPDFQPQYDIGERVIAIVLRALADGRLRQEQIENAWRRIVAMRARLPEPRI